MRAGSDCHVTSAPLFMRAPLYMHAPLYMRACVAFPSCAFWSRGRIQRIEQITQAQVLTVSNKRLYSVCSVMVLSRLLRSHRV